MKFLTGTRSRSGSYTVIPARPIMDMTTGQSQLTPPVRVRFDEHRIDTASQEMVEQYEAFCMVYNVGKDPKKHLTPDDLQKKVEQHLLNHPDFGRSDGHGIFLDKTDTLAEMELRAKGVQRRCIFVQELGEESIQCGDFVDNPESDYCSTHEGIVEMALAGVAAEKGAAEKD